MNGRWSSRDEDDEEALKWAAYEKLHTISRPRKVVLTSCESGAKQTDIYDLGWQERRALLERLLKVAEEDNENFLLEMKNRIDSGKKQFTILNDVSGIIKPGRMTLFLGPVSSGKTTLLLALAQKLDPALKCSGRVTYNGHGMNEFVPQRTASYFCQNDLHIEEMIVRETLAFSSKATKGQDASLITGYILKIVYQGPREHVLSFFESMGFRCPERKGVADLLLHRGKIKCNIGCIKMNLKGLSQPTNLLRHSNHSI
ncbi:hypothetical protein PTKIN_Ptkin18bG0049700 [Pterospermum kingtungense]